jgi:hypothetical protein
MEDQQKNRADNTRIKPHVIPPNEVVQNPIPKGNENIHARTDQPKPKNTDPAHGVGSEITDGEDA